MPTYEYECQKCGHKFDLSQPMTAKPRRTCPKCKGRVKRLLGTGAGLIFKGSGFYTTDYRKAGYKEAAKKDSSSASSSSGTKESSTPSGTPSTPSKPDKGTAKKD